jgi:hypothetical protein
MIGKYFLVYLCVITHQSVNENPDFHQIIDDQPPKRLHRRRRRRPKRSEEILEAQHEIDRDPLGPV